MDSHQAFDLTISAIRDNIGGEITGTRFSETSFGSFYVSFSVSGLDRSILNDRGQLFICEQPRGEGDCNLLFNDLRTVGEQELVSMLTAKLR